MARHQQVAGGGQEAAQGGRARKPEVHACYNRAVDQPYKFVGTWLIDQWKQIGITVEQKAEPTGPFYANLRRKKDFDVALDFNCQAVVNPLLDVAAFVSDDKTSQPVWRLSRTANWTSCTTP